MTLSMLVVIIVAAIAASYMIGYTRSQQVARAVGGARNLASLPGYYGMMMALWALIPAMIVLVFWSIADSGIILSFVKGALPESVKQLPVDELTLAVSQLQNIAAGIGSVDDLGQDYLPALNTLNSMTAISQQAMPILVICVLIIGAIIGYRYIKGDFNARHSVEKVINATLFICSSIAILTTVGIVFSVLFESIRFFGKVPFFDFLLGTHWSPQIAIRADQTGASGSFGVIPLIVGTLLISFIALLIAVPVGLMSAIYLSEYASRKVRSIVKPILEILAGIPTVVYGFFAALTVAPAIRRWGDGLRDWGAENGIDWLATLAVSSESALAAGMVMGVMIIPFVSSLSDDVINAVPQSLRDGSLGMGATQSETIKRVVFPAALPGIVGGILLAASRAIGETMIVVMAAGLAANLTVNPLEAVTTVTVQIVTLLVGDQEFDSAKTLAAFALGMFLFVITLALNVIALRVVKKYREQYD